MFARSALVAVALVLATTLAHAATVSNVSGGVSVSNGSGFTPLANGATVSAGQRIMVPASGAAQVSFGVGCTVSLPAGQTFTVPAESPCVATGGLDPAYVTAGLVLVGGAVVGAIAIADNGSSSPTWPVSP